MAHRARRIRQQSRIPGRFSTACNNIDRRIDRTLIYGTLTAALGLVYADAVLVLGDVFVG
jgi:hypothetical protein